MLSRNTSIRLLFFYVLIFLTACGGGSENSTPEDIIAPTITLIGDDNITLFLDDEYIELGVRATDNETAVDNISIAIKGAVNPHIAGDYTITYTATDSSGNSSSITRVINVIPMAFITIWKTDAEGLSNNNQISIGTSDNDYSYDYDIDWGDGEIDEHVMGDIIHTYESIGTYTIKISGYFPHIYFEQDTLDSDNNLIKLNSDKSKLLSIEQWGDIEWSSMSRAFLGCKLLKVNAGDIPNLSNVTNMAYMFNGISGFNTDSRTNINS